MPDNTIGWLLMQVGWLAQPIRLAATSPDAAEDLFATLGWELPQNVQLSLQTAQLIENLVEKIKPINEATDDQPRELETSLALYADLAQAIQAFLAQVPTLLHQDFALSQQYLDASAIEHDLVTRLCDLLVMRYAEVRACVIYALLRLLGFFDIQYLHADPAIYGTDHNRRVIRWDRLQMLFTDGASLPADVYGWGTDHFDVNELLRRLGNVIKTLGGRVQTATLSATAEAQLLGPAPPGVDTSPLPLLLASLFQDSTAGASVDVGVALMALRPTAAGATDAGLGASPYALGSVQLSVPLSTDLPIALEIEAGADITGGLAVFVRPGSVQAKTALDGGVGVLASGRIGMGIRYGNPTSEVVRLISLPGGSRIEVQELYLRGGGEAQTTGTIDGYIEAGLVGGHVVITMSEADGFLANLIPDGIQAHVDLMLGYSPRRGIYFQGSGSLELTIALNLELGPISLDALHLVLGISGDSTTPGALTLEASLDAGGEIGPVAASVERIGMKGTLGMHPGNLGPVDLALAFKPPDGLGLAVDAGPVSGGGFISFDPEAGRYTGVLHLEVYSFSITAIGLLDTRLPGGAPGYSFLVIITVEFTPIQLGYGFTLNGVGGLAGIHRTMVVDAIQAGLRNHAIDHILFPPDPIHNAPAIISDLRTIFPPQEGRYVFGPMAIIGWETFIALEIGILLEVPAPVRIVLLWQLSAIFPERNAAVIRLYLDILGILNFEEKKLSFDGALHDSVIAVFPVVGDFAVRLAWGDDASFLMAVGGFNAQFHAPPSFPSLRRLAISWGAGGNPRISLSAYVALTSNTLQFGAAAELLATAGSFSVHGWTGFDALFQFTPFMVTADLSAGMELKNGDAVLCGIHVTANLTGPGPWRVWGDAAVSLACFNVSVAFDATFGPAPAQPLPVPRVDIWTLLLPALQDPRNWSPAAPPAAVAIATLLASPPPRDGSALVDPLGGATLRQRVVPLGPRIRLFNGAPPLGVDSFAIYEVEVGGAVVTTSAIQDHFAPAQFAQLTDAERLSLPSFELMDAGVTFGDDALTFGAAVAVDVTYDTTLIDATSRHPLDRFALPLDHQLAQMRTGMAARSPLRSSGPRKFAPPPASAALIALGEESFVVASTDDLGMRLDLAAPTTKTAAADALARHLVANPADRGKLQVVRSAELSFAA